MIEIYNVTTDAPTNQNISQEDVFYRTIWLTDVIINSFLCVLSLYIVVALIFYELKRVERKTKKSTVLNLEGKFTQSTREICIATSIPTFLYHVFSLCTLAIQKTVSNNDLPIRGKSPMENSCQVLSGLEIFIMIMCTGLVYLHLWSRQRAFYLNLSLEVLNSPCVKITSYCLLALWICYFIPAPIVSCAIVRYKLRIPGGCHVVDKTWGVYRDIILTWMIVSIFMQIALLSLFLNPILRRTQLMKRNTRKSSVDSNSASTLTFRLLKRIKKVVILTVTCLISHIIIATTTLFIYRPNANTYVFIYNLNFMINLFAIIGCFDNWSFMLWPWTEKFKTSGTHHRRKSVSSTENLSSCHSKPEDLSVSKNGRTTTTISPEQLETDVF